jgi:iron complex transport system substrate-binding protein
LEAEVKFWRFGFIAILLALSFVLTGCRAQFEPGDYTDDMGRVVSISTPPQRIVSHVPGITEILFALGLGNRVVAVSDYCDYPPEAREKPSVGAYFEPSIETIISQAPDLVLTDGHSESIKGLSSLGVTFVVIDPKDLDGVLRDIRLLGQITGAEARAEALAGEMSARISEIVSQVEGAPRRRVFYVFDATDLNNPWTAGPGSFANDLVTLAGGENIAAVAPAPWVQFSIEAIVSADPEIIIADASMGTAVVSLEELRAHPAWQEMAAVKENRVYVVNGDLVNRPGPRIVQGLEAIAKIIHPELFETGVD